MFTQRQTDSFGLIGTNARNSDCSMEGQRLSLYGQKLISNMPFEQYDQPTLEQIFRCPPLVIQRNSSLMSQDPAELFLYNKFRTSYGSENSGMGSFDNYNEVLKSEMPFDMEKDNILSSCYDESTHESQETSQSRPQSPSEKTKELFTIESSTSDQEDCESSDPKMEKLMQDLDFIDQPLSSKRVRKQKTAPVEKSTTQQLFSMVKTQSSEAINTLSEEEKRRRKNKEQIKVLQNEYTKNQNWTRAFMKDLAKATGLKSSQVYKWNWDQKKKEVDDLKMKKMFYPNEIFAVVDPNGNNIAKPVFQRFIVDKQ